MGWEVASRPFSRARAEARRLRLLAGDVVLAVAMVGILKPIAGLLPLSGALAIARSLGRLVAVMPGYGREQVRRMRRSFGRDTPPDRLVRLAAERISRPLCDSVVLRRAMCGRAEFKTWRLEQRTTASVDKVRASDESFIVATAHFSRQAFFALYGSEVLPQTTSTLMLTRTKRSSHPRTWWLSYHYGQMLDCMRVWRPDLKIVHPGGPSAYKHLVASLREARNAVVIFVDAPWAPSKGQCFARPFAGLEARVFATGTARLSRMAKRPIVVCIPHMADDHTVVLNWTRVIQPSPAESDEADKALMNLILDDVEKAIGRWPAQYLLECLGERRWDGCAERWVAEP